MHAVPDHHTYTYAMHAMMKIARPSYTYAMHDEMARPSSHHAARPSSHMHDEKTPCV